MEKCRYACKEEKLKEIAYAIYDNLSRNKKPVFMCIGSDKVVADSLGPMVGEMLKKKYEIPAYIYGTLDYNINAHNLNVCYNYISTMHADRQIVVIDAGISENAGEIVIGKGAFAGVGKSIPMKPMGDMSILGIVGSWHKEFKLGTVRLQEIVSMADIISKAIAMALSAKSEKYYKYI